MARRKSKAEQLRLELARLSQAISEDLRLASLSERRLERYAYLFVIVLPLLDSKGRRVFTDSLLDELFLILDTRFGGCLTASSSSHPPYWGLWHPPESDAAEGEKDYVTVVQVFANPIEPTNRFFARLKQILKSAGDVEQEEILISRTDCWLI